MSLEEDVQPRPCEGNLRQALAAARLEIEQLHVALHSRLIIGRAEGILMERLGMDADVAFEYLKRVSTHTNRKLVSVAEDIIRTGDIPKHG